tara:strand:+ start:1213 stop:1437 length:225 start_codon:yes stop_codon:yes gene_type:complete
MVYMPPEDGTKIIAWAASFFPTSVFVTYEQVRPNDAFGQTMMRNLQVSIVWRNYLVCCNVVWVLVFVLSIEITT